MPDRTPADTGEIVAVAAGLFARRGYATTSVAEIVAELQCTPPSLYRRFPSKLALLHAVLDAALDRLAGPGDLDTRVRRAIAAASSHPDLVVTYVRERRWIDAELFPAVARRDADHATAWTTAIGLACPDLDAGSAALRHGAIDGAVTALAVAPRGAGGARLRTAFETGLHALASTPSVARPTESAPIRQAWHLPPTRRQTLIDAAIALIGARGYADVRLQDVGAAVGIAGPSVLQHFATKQEILVAAFDRAITELMIAARIATEHAADASDALARLVAALAETAALHRDLYVTLYREFGALDEDQRTRLAHLRNELDHVWGAVLCELHPDLPAEPSRAIARAGVEAVLNGVRHSSAGTSTADLVAATLSFLDAAAGYGISRTRPKA